MSHRCRSASRRGTSITNYLQSDKNERVNRSLLKNVSVTIFMCSLAVRASSVWQRLPVDDAYISFRHAVNVASGHGLVFRLGEIDLDRNTRTAQHGTEAVA